MSSSGPFTTEDEISPFGSQDEPRLKFDLEDDIVDSKTEEESDSKTSHSPTPDLVIPSKPDFLLSPNSKGFFFINSLDDLQKG